MIYVIIGMSVLLMGIGFILTENNASQLLSGYNTMSVEERLNVDIKAYVLFFKKFHLFLGVSFLGLGTILTFFINENAGGIFLGTYPILGYMYFLWKSKDYSRNLPTTAHTVGFYSLGGLLVLVSILLWLGFKEDTMIFDSTKIVFQGSYGETIPVSDLQSLELVSELPDITIKTNGFALGTIRKGYFRTKQGETVKLILNSDAKPYILIKKKNGHLLYFSAKHPSNTILYQNMKKILHQ